MHERVVPPQQIDPSAGSAPHGASLHLLLLHTILLVHWQQFQCFGHYRLRHNPDFVHSCYALARVSKTPSLPWKEGRIQIGVRCDG